VEREAAKQPSAEVDDDHADGPFSSIKTAQNSDPSTAGKVSRCGPGEVRRFNAARTAADAGAEDDAADDDDADADVPYFTLTAQNSDPSTAGKVSRCGPGEIRRFKAARGRRAKVEGAKRNKLEWQLALGTPCTNNVKRTLSATLQVVLQSVRAGKAKSGNSHWPCSAE
jgi:hypothetical protein